MSNGEIAHTFGSASFPQRQGTYRHRRRGYRAVVFVFAFALLGSLWVVGCASPSEMATSSSATVDTLPNGAIRTGNAGAGLWTPGREWLLEETLRLGRVTGDDPEVFGELFAIAVGDSNELYLLDRASAEIRVFSSHGAHLRSFGHRGRGPGELAAPVGLSVGPAGRLWVVDPGAARYSVFTRDGTFVEAVRRPVKGFTIPWMGGFDGSQHLIDVSGVPPHFTHVRLDPRTGETEAFDLPTFPGDQIIEKRNPDDGGGVLSVRVPFSPERIHALDRKGRLWVGASNRYRLVLRTLEGDTLRIVEREAERPPVTDRDRIVAREGISWFTDRVGPIDPSVLPAQQPYFSGFIPADDGHLWVARYAPPGAGWTHFDVFDPDGRYLGAVQSPVTISPHPVAPVIQDGYLHAAIEDELGVQRFVRLAIISRETVE